MTSKVFLIGIVAGLAGALALAGVFSAVSNQGTAQMMGNQGMMGTQAKQGQTPWQWNNYAGFSTSGLSNVYGVQITGIAISAANEVTVNLKHTESGSAPNVTVIAYSNPTYMMGRMHGAMGMMGGYGYGSPYGMGMMYGGYPGMMMYGYNNGTWQNNTQWQQQMQAFHNQMMGGAYYGEIGPAKTYGYNPQLLNSTALPQTLFQSQTGSAVVNSGWTTNTSVKVRLDGDGSAFDSNSIVVMVYPLTS
jgi:hypothetical protein